MAYGNLANTPVKTDSNGYVQVTIGGGTVTAMTITTLTTTKIIPPTDSTTALLLGNAAGTGFVVWDSSSSRMAIGIATAPQDTLDCYGASNAILGIRHTNTTSGTASRSALQLTAGTSNGYLYVQSQGYTGTLRNPASGLTCEVSGAGGLTLSNTNSAGNWIFLDSNQAIAAQIANSSGLLTTYGKVTTAGRGVPSIYAAGSVVAQTTVAASICTYTTPTSDGDYEVSGNVLVTASGTHSFSLNCTYTDEGGTARTLVMPVAQLAGAFAASGLITNVTGAGPYESAAMHIRCKQTTAITLGLSAGSFTSVTYNARAAIRQLQ